MPRKSNMKWYRMDLHLHTPASDDYQEPDATILDILRKAEFRGLDIIALTDHNSVQGYARMLQEVEQLLFLERLGRLEAEEAARLAEFQRLSDALLVLPGFEFTATFGFHVLGIFAPGTTVSFLEHLLLSLNVPPEALQKGSSVVGASADVLTAYRMIYEAGGICIAAHVNSAHGVAMRGSEFGALGGQTRIAYTQDRHLHALEATDLGRRGRFSTYRFFDGTKPEYPRRMRIIQGSDAHRINAEENGNKRANLGVGDRVTEVLLPERSFTALLDLFNSNDFTRSRPYRGDQQPYDPIQAARERGANLVTAFHDSVAKKGGKRQQIITDVCALANTNGGQIFVGLSANAAEKPRGVQQADRVLGELRHEINQQLTPALAVELDIMELQRKRIIRILVPRGEERPYAIDQNQFYVRSEAETNLAVRDEIVRLARESAEAESDEAALPTPTAQVRAAPAPAIAARKPERDPLVPRTGVEIVGSEQSGGSQRFILRDLRNGSVVKNVTESSARRLWLYAIQQRLQHPVVAGEVQWQGDRGLVRRHEKQGHVRYDLALRSNGQLRVFYGVSESGMSGAWQQFLTPESESEESEATVG
ncbi:MAG: putative DNA binding domain-containing protein [Chloroflexi bacterium]|nr:putative DNA binding domain-containing protein [Chloroflexota bacterium]